MFVTGESLAEVTFGLYQPVQLLGQGNLSSVYVAQHLEMQQAVMLTVLTLPEECKGRARERFMSRFMQEASLLTRLIHPNIVPVLDFGEHDSYPYIVTPLLEGNSLSTILKQKKSLSPSEILNILQQLAAGLDHAHRQGVVHGALKPSYILINKEQNVQIAGFGLARILAMTGIGRVAHSHSHLFSVSGSFLANPMYIAPEVVEGSVPDEPSDVYSLGIILFEMLSGRPPFTGTDSLLVALQHTECPIPSLQEISPSAPAAFDLVISRTLERDPEQRLSSAGKVASAFARILRVLQEATNPLPAVQGQQESISSLPTNIMPLMAETGKWDLELPLFSTQLPAVTLPGKDLLSASTPDPAAQPTLAPASEKDSNDKNSSKTSRRSTTQGHPVIDAPTLTPEMPSTTMSKPPKTDLNTFAAAWSYDAIMQPEEPFLSTSPELKAQKIAIANKEQALPGAKPVSVQPRKGRRIVVFAVAGVAAAGILGAAGFTIAHLIQSSANQNMQEQKRPTPTTKKAIIGNTHLAINTASDFVNPQDQKDSILIHLPGGNFAAYEKACPHQGVAVVYDPQTHMLICPRHRSTFDPANKAVVTNNGPAKSPLTPVPIHINGDGTITIP